MAELALSNNHSPYKFSVFYADRKSKMASTAIHRLTLDPMGKYSNAFFSETTNMIKAKLYMNVHIQLPHSHDNPQYFHGWESKCF